MLEMYARYFVEAHSAGANEYGPNDIITTSGNLITPFQTLSLAHHIYIYNMCVPLRLLSKSVLSKLYLSVEIRENQCSYMVWNSPNCLDYTATGRGSAKIAKLHAKRTDRKSTEHAQRTKYFIYIYIVNQTHWSQPQFARSAMRWNWKVSKRVVWYKNVWFLHRYTALNLTWYMCL